MYCNGTLSLGWGRLAIGKSEFKFSGLFGGKNWKIVQNLGFWLVAKKEEKPSLSCLKPISRLIPRSVVTSTYESVAWLLQMLKINIYWHFFFTCSQATPLKKMSIYVEFIFWSNQNSFLKLHFFSNLSPLSILICIRKVSSIIAISMRHFQIISENPRKCLGSMFSNSKPK